METGRTAPNSHQKATKEIGSILWPRIAGKLPKRTGNRREEETEAREFYRAFPREGWRCITCICRCPCRGRVLCRRSRTPSGTPPSSVRRGRRRASPAKSRRQSRPRQRMPRRTAPRAPCRRRWPGAPASPPTAATPRWSSGASACSSAASRASRRTGFAPSPLARSRPRRPVSIPDSVAVSTLCVPRFERGAETGGWGEGFWGGAAGCIKGGGGAGNVRSEPSAPPTCDTWTLLI